MTLVVYAEASGIVYPGHMVVGQERPDRAPRFYGYRFDPADMPPEVRSPENWPNYLLNNTIPGKITDETGYIAHVLAIPGRIYFEKRGECDTPIENHVPPREQWEPHARYSYNPDTFHSVDQPCYNCVTWAILISNRLVDGFLPHVRQGRISLILKQLQKRDSNTHEGS